ncbi:restriction endonuclease subunit S [Bradyrhizobium ontarionense]|uniref:Restriction endonuclease subunit S n=1 Tax=Bradyrhizobium ontarionense TaxID=2898149 RepID=A0ABY3RCN9_9BRAD|nr:restriction endonuclease subunit S [Bradyrhizobium sp. A19]UFZ05053.1 restriction endonuclease subunit S [Bradyrhizobium sp. A19]
MDQLPADSERALPPGWVSVRVDQVGEVRLGRQRSPDQESGAYMTRYVRAANITPAGMNISNLLEMNFTPAEREAFGLKPGDVLLTEASGSASQVGRASIWRGEVEPCCFQNTVIRFRPHLTTSEYALVVFRHYAAAGVFAGVARGVGIQHLGGSRFAEILYPLPPLAEQKRITEVVDVRLANIREAEARLRSALGHLKEQVREILAAAAAGELVPQSPQAAEPDRAHASSRSRQISLFENEAVSAQKVLGLGGTVPEGWRWCRVEQAGQVTLGRQRAPKHERGHNMRPYLRVANVYEDRIDTSDVLHMNFEPEEVAIYELRDGDVLLNEGQSPELVGRPAIYRGEVPGACFQNTLIRFRSGDEIEPEYALFVFRHYMHSGVFRKIARWSTNIAHLGLERFRSLPFPIPPRGEQRRIVAEARRRLEAAASQMLAIEASLARVPEFERELLAAAVAGDLVPQDPGDEPASELFRRLGPPRKTEATLPQSSLRADIMSKRRPRPTQQAEPTPDLAAVLQKHGGSLPMPELFAQAGYNRDLPEHVELFYLALRKALGKTIRLTGESAENAELEANAA